MTVTPGNGPLPPHMKFNFRHIRVELIRDNALSKQICIFQQWAGRKPSKGSGGAAMMVMNLALPSECFEGFRPAHCRRKAYLLAGASSTINQMHCSGIFGLLGGARGPFLAAASMVMWVLMAVGRWPLAVGPLVLLLARILHNSRNGINVHTQNIFFRSKIFRPV